MAKRKERSGFVLYFADLKALTEVMDDASIGQLVLALSAYAQDGTEPHFTDGGSRMAFELLRGKVDRDKEHYAEVAEARAEAARRREAERKQSSQIAQVPQACVTGRGYGYGEGVGIGGGYGKGMPIDPRIDELERLKSKYAEEDNQQ